MNFHDDALVTEEMIGRYLRRSLDEGTTELFESHYLECDSCFNALRAAELLMAGLNRGVVKRKTVGDVAVLNLIRRIRWGGNRLNFRNCLEW